MPNRITTVVNWFETELTATLGPTDLIAQVSDTGALVAPVILVVEPDDPTQREVIYFNGNVTAATLETTALENRYLAGSAAGSGLTHGAGSPVRLAVVAQHVNDLNDRIGAHSHLGGNEGPVIGHADLDGIGPDDHHNQAHTHSGDGSGAVDHNDLAGSGPDDHHDEDHAARHAPAGGDPLTGYPTDAEFDALALIVTENQGDAAAIGNRVNDWELAWGQDQPGGEVSLSTTAVTVASVAALGYPAMIVGSVRIRNASGTVTGGAYARLVNPSGTVIAQSPSVQVLPGGESMLVVHFAGETILTGNWTLRVAETASGMDIRAASPQLSLLQAKAYI